MTKKLAEVAFSSEWFLAKMFHALEESEIRELFELKTIAGRQPDKEAAIRRMLELRSEKENENVHMDYARRNGSAEIQSLSSLEAMLRGNKLDYFVVDERTGTIDDKIFDNCDGIYISTNNATHAKLILQAAERGIPVLCEKPLCVLLDENLRATDSQLVEIRSLVNRNIVLLDAEHYSYKAAAQNFYRNIENILHGREIVKIKGEIIECDSPSKGRNLKLLSKKSRTGLLTDTGVHPLSFVANLGYYAVPEDAEYGIFEGIDVEAGKRVAYEAETSCKATYVLHPDKTSQKRVIRDGAKFELEVEKFGQYRRLGKSKKLVLTLSDNSTLTLDFDDKEGKICEDANGIIIPHRPITPVNPSEYINILQEFNRAIDNPSYHALTDFRNSIRTLQSIYETYKLRQITENQNRKIHYETN